MLTLGNLKTDPTYGQDAAEMTMREEGDISRKLAQAGDQSVRAVGNLSGCFTFRTAVVDSSKLGRTECL